MIRRSGELARRRERLVASCAEQRNALTVQGHAVMEKLAVFDMGLTLFERFKKNPAWIALLAVSLVAIKPRRLLSGLQTGLLAWQALRTFAQMRAPHS